MKRISTMYTHQNANVQLQNKYKLTV